uniref:transposase n=1 Tax=Virgisporangium aurantiacum TaxID=175570 RepID=UPI00357125AB
MPAGPHEQALNHFVTNGLWDAAAKRERLPVRMDEAISPAAWAVDDTGWLKCGTASVCGPPVHRHGREGDQLPGRDQPEPGHRHRVLSGGLAAARPRVLGPGRWRRRPPGPMRRPSSGAGRRRCRPMRCIGRSGGYWSCVERT